MNDLYYSIQHSIHYLKYYRGNVKNSLKKQKITRTINTLEEILEEIKAAHEVVSKENI